MRIIYFGTPEFASSQLEAILAGGFDVVAVVTTPDRPAGRGKKMHSSEVKETALKYNLPVLQPERLRDPYFLKELESYHADLFIVVAFRMLPEVVWNMPPKGTFNLHASLLPQYRGAAPINHAIINGETETGVTTFLLDKEIDTGAVIMQEKVKIEDDETAGSLHDKLMILGNQVVIETIKIIERGEVNPQKQDSMIEKNDAIKNAPKIFKEFCNIDWTKDLKVIYDFIRGLSPYPAAHTQFISEQNEILDLKIFETKMERKTISDDYLYHVFTDKKTYLKVAVNGGYISILSLQQAGKKAMTIAEFLRGTRVSEDFEVI